MAQRNFQILPAANLPNRTSSLVPGAPEPAAEGPDPFVEAVRLLDEAAAAIAEGEAFQTQVVEALLTDSPSKAPTASKFAEEPLDSDWIDLSFKDDEVMPAKCQPAIPMLAVPSAEALAVVTAAAVANVQTKIAYELALQGSLQSSTSVSVMAEAVPNRHACEARPVRPSRVSARTIETLAAQPLAWQNIRPAKVLSRQPSLGQRSSCVLPSQSFEDCCPKGHRLQQCVPGQDTRFAAHTCDVCNRPVTTIMHRCEVCNFDKCLHCYGRQAPSQALAGSCGLSGGQSAFPPRSSELLRSKSCSSRFQFVPPPGPQLVQRPHWIQTHLSTGSAASRMASCPAPLRSVRSPAAEMSGRTPRSASVESVGNGLESSRPAQLMSVRPYPAQNVSGGARSLSVESLGTGLMLSEQRLPVGIRGRTPRSTSVQSSRTGMDFGTARQAPRSASVESLGTRLEVGTPRLTPRLDRTRILYPTESASSRIPRSSSVESLGRIWRDPSGTICPAPSCRLGQASLLCPGPTRTPRLRPTQSVPASPHPASFRSCSPTASEAYTPTAPASGHVTPAVSLRRAESPAASVVRSPRMPREVPSNTAARRSSKGFSNFMPAVSLRSVESPAASVVRSPRMPRMPSNTAAFWEVARTGSHTPTVVSQVSQDSPLQTAFTFGACEPGGSMGADEGGRCGGRADNLSKSLPAMPGPARSCSGPAKPQLQSLPQRMGSLLQKCRNQLASSKQGAENAEKRLNDSEGDLVSAFGRSWRRRRNKKTTPQAIEGASTSGGQNMVSIADKPLPHPRNACPPPKVAGAHTAHTDVQQDGKTVGSQTQTKGSGGHVASESCPEITLDAYLPKTIRANTVLVEEKFGTWRAMPSWSYGAVAFRKSKHLDDVMEKVVGRGELVAGVDDGDGWVRCKIPIPSSDNASNSFLGQQRKLEDVLLSSQQLPRGGSRTPIGHLVGQPFQTSLPTSQPGKFMASRVS